MPKTTKTVNAGPPFDATEVERLARQALAEITATAHVGALAEISSADHVATARFATTQGGYLGWFWTVAVAVNPGMQPSVLETELVAGHGSLTAPDWVPWADRLEDYVAQQAVDAQSAADDDEQHDSDDDDDDDGDDDDDDSDDHSDSDSDSDAHDDDGVFDGVFDGVDIDLHLDDASHPGKDPAATGD